MGKNNRARRIRKKRLIANRTNREKIKAKKGIGPVWKTIENPFNGIGATERKEVIQDIAQHHEVIYQESLSKIKEIIKNYDVCSLLAMLAVYYLPVAVNENGILTKDSDQQIFPAHIEICQALLLQLPQSKLGLNVVIPTVFQELHDSLTKLMKSQNLRTISDKIEETEESKNAITLFQQLMRMNTMMVRNWGFFSQVKTISSELYCVFDNYLEDKYGFTVRLLISFFELLYNNINKPLSAFNASFQELAKSHNNEELIYAYYKLIGQEENEAKVFLQDINLGSLDLKELFSLLIAHYSLRFSDFYDFSLNDLSNKLNIDKKIIDNLINQFSYKWGDLEGKSFEHFFLANPIALRPIIRINEDRVFCVLPQTFFSYIIPSIEKLFELEAKISLSDRRSKYLEEKIVEIIKSKFQESFIIPNLKWKDGSDEYETDLVVIIDSYLIIIEAKSGKVTEHTLRGAPDRLKRDLKEILLVPNIQSKRLKQKLEELITHPEIIDELREKLPINLCEIHKIIRVSVSLENFGAIQANIFQLKTTGWVPHDFEPCPSMMLSDFETLFSFLDKPIQIIHYLERRQEIETEYGYLGDELDLMGLYISTLFNLSNFQKNSKLLISGMSFPIDNYYNSKEHGIDISKPEPKMSSLFTDILNQLERRHIPRWTEIGVVLHRFSPDEQNELIKLKRKLEINVAKNWMKKGHDNIAVYVPSNNSEYALCYVLYNNKNANQRKEFIQEAANIGVEPEHVKKCLVIAKNIDDDSLSYHFIGLFDK